MSLFFWLFTFAITLWHRKLVTADVTAVFVNNQHGIQRRRHDFKQQRGRQMNFPRNAGQSLVLISCLKCCGTQAQFTGGQKFEILIFQGNVATCLR